MMKRSLLIVSAVAALAAFGCVERKLTVNSNPPGARVYLDGEEKGITPVTFRFDFYGRREFLLRKDGYRTLRETRDVNGGLYDVPGFDALADLTPIPLTDHRTFNFELEPVQKVNANELLDRANEMKYRLEGKRVPAGAKAFEQPKPETPAKPVEPETAPPETPLPAEPKAAPGEPPAPKEEKPAEPKPATP